METAEIAFTTFFSIIAIFFALAFLAPNIVQPIIEGFANLLFWIVKAIVDLLARLIFGA